MVRLVEFDAATEVLARFIEESKPGLCGASAFCGFDHHIQESS